MIIKHGLVVDPASRLAEHMDILVKNGKIARIAPEISEDSEEILEAGGLVVGPGLIDTHVHFRDPGFTYKEDIHTGAKASAKGGFTTAAADAWQTLIISMVRSMILMRSAVRCKGNV